MWFGQTCSYLNMQAVSCISNRIGWFVALLVIVAWMLSFGCWGFSFIVWTFLLCVLLKWRWYPFLLFWQPSLGMPTSHSAFVYLKRWLFLLVFLPCFILLVWLRLMFVDWFVLALHLVNGWMSFCCLFHCWLYLWTTLGLIIGTTEGTLFLCLIWDSWA